VNVFCALSLLRRIYSYWNDVPKHAGAVVIALAERELSWLFTLPTRWGTIPLSFGRDRVSG